MARKNFGKNLSRPINELALCKGRDSVKFIEQDKERAQKTRVAACMYIGRHHYNLTTTVEENTIWILRDKDYRGKYDEYDLRDIS